MKAKYDKYDLVMISEGLGEGMSHFESGVLALVEFSSDTSEMIEYSLYLKDSGSTAWYNEDQLTLVEKNAKHILNEWPIILSTY